MLWRVTLPHTRGASQFHHQSPQKYSISERRGTVRRFQIFISRFASPDRRGVKRLEGNVSSLRVQKKPDSVIVYDEQALPAAWKDVLLTMPAFVWEALLGRLDQEERTTFEGRIKRKEFRADKRALAPELKKGIEIPGADLSFGELRLVIE